MDSNLLQVARALMDLLAGVLCLYNARSYSALVRVFFGVIGLIFLSLSASIGLSRSGNPLVVPFNDAILTSLIAVVVVVQIILALNGRALPLHRRKTDK